MNRRSITLVLCMTYVASQLATMPHAHEVASHDHGARPHVHVSWLDRESTTQHGHSHHPGHSHRHKNDARHEHHVPNSPAGEDHDSDAVYIANESGMASHGSNIDALDSLMRASTLGVVQAAAVPSLIVDCSIDATFSRNCKPACALYLALRTLRI
jgi:hypothetical protein